MDLMAYKHGQKIASLNKFQGAHVEGWFKGLDLLPPMLTIFFSELIL
jgi:hypothetical protein